MDDLNPLAGTAHLLEEVDSKSSVKTHSNKNILDMTQYFVALEYLYFVEN